MKGLEAVTKSKDWVASTEDRREDFQIKVYPRRWLILGLFTLLAAANTMQWIQYTIVENIVARYYGVSTFAVECTALTFNVLYVILFLPTSYLMNRMSLRKMCLVSTILTCLGSWIKVFSVNSDRFIVTLIGQIFVGMCQMPVSSLPAMVAAHWFGSKQVATATALGVFGCPLGVATTLFLMPIFVQNHENVEDIGYDLFYYLLSVAIFCTVISAAIIIFFQNQPAFPPSEARALQMRHREQDEGFFKPFKRILKNKSFLMLWNAHGIGIGCLNAITTMLNPLYLAHFPGGEGDAGRCGLILLISGTFGSVIFGRIVDKTKKFKATLVFLIIFCLIGQTLLAGSLYAEVRWTVNVSSAIIGFFMIAYLSTGYEVCAEMTYPESEATSLAILNLANQLYGIILIVIISRLMTIYSDLAAHLCLTIALLVGTVIALLTKDERRRQAAVVKSVQCGGILAQT